jgi:hypothetical protein
MNPATGLPQSKHLRSGGPRIFRGCGWWLWAAAWIVAGASPPAAWGQARYAEYQEPQWFTFHLSEISAGVYAQGILDETRYQDGQTISHEHFFVGPSLGLNADGSFYHPNLARYFINSEGAYGWSQDRFSGSSSREEWEYLGRFDASIELLENKPYHGSLFANYDHTFRDNDFFNRVMVEGWRYGARAGWSLGRWTLNADYLHRDERSTSPFPVTQVVSITNVVNGTNVITLQTNEYTSDLVTDTREDALNLGARHERPSGGTVFNYNWNRYNRSDTGGIGEGNDHTFSLGDTERFGTDDRFRFNGNLSYLIRDNNLEESDELLAEANLSADHSPTLSSYYNLNYDHFTANDFNSDSFFGQASLRHQLYDSLTSTLTVRGSDAETSDQVSSGYSRRYGGGIVEYYTKRLGSRSRLRVSNSLFIDHTDQQSTGVARDERHSFTEGGPVPDSFFLNLANVVEATIVVTDVNNTQPPLLRDFDYRVSRFGARTVIEKLHPGVPNVVLVDYRALPTPAGSYETFSENFQVRLEFWQNLVGVYGRLNFALNNAPAELRVQDVTTYTVGGDFTWRWLRLGAEYEIYDSTDSDYRSVRLFQSAAFRPDEASTLSIDFTESWITYLDTDREEQNYQLLTRYHRALTHRLGLDADAGISLRRGFGVDQVLAVARPSIKYAIGKTTIDAGYDYEYKQFIHREERQKHMFFVRLRRIF